MSHRNRIGFTLIELLVVISIITMLVAILLPALGKARSSARTLKCLSTQRSMGMSLQMYADMSKSWIPPHMANAPGTLYFDPSPNVGSNKHLFHPYYLTKVGLLPPVSEWANQTVSSVATRICPEVEPNIIRWNSSFHEWNYSHYMMAANYAGYYNGLAWLTGPSGYAGPTRLIDLHKPGQSMALADAPYDPQNKSILSVQMPIYGGVTSWLEKRYVIGMNGAVLNMNLTPHNVTHFGGHRHGGNNVNFTFFDGHAETRQFQGETAPYGGFGVLLSTNGKVHANSGGSISYWD